MLTETLWNGAMEREWAFNPLKAGVASAPTQRAAEAAAPGALRGPGLPTQHPGAHVLLSSVLLPPSSLVLWGEGVFPAGWSAGLRLCLGCCPERWHLPGHLDVLMYHE